MMMMTMMVPLVILNALVLLPMIYSTTTIHNNNFNHTHTTTTTIVEYNHENSDANMVDVPGSNSKTLYMKSSKNKKPLMSNLFSNKYKKCQSELQALIDSTTTTSASIQLNNSREAELMIQLDKEHSIVVLLQQQLQSLKLQLQKNHLNNNNSSSISSSCIEVSSKQINSNCNNSNNLLKQLEQEHNTVVSLQQQIKSFQLPVPGNNISQQDYTSLKRVNITYTNTNSTDELLKQLKKDRIYINSLEQNVQALTLQIHSFHRSNTTQGQLQSKDAIIFDQLQKQLERERNNSISLTLQLKVLKSSQSIINNLSYIESSPFNQTSMYHLQKQLQDERNHASSLQVQLQSLQSQINNTSLDSDTASSMKALQKQLDDKHINVTNLQHQVQSLQLQLQHSLSLNDNNNHSSAVDNIHIMSSSVSIDDLQKQLEDERMRNSRLEQQLQSKTFSDSNQVNRQIINITTSNLQKQLDDVLVKYGALEQQLQLLFGQQKTDGDVLINSELIKQYNARIIKIANIELEKQLEDEREKSTRLEKQVLSLDFQKTMLVDQVKKGFMEDIRKDAFNTVSMTSELNAKTAEITRYKQLFAAKEEEATQLKLELSAFQANPLSSSSVSLSSSSSSSSVSALKKKYTLHPEMNEIMSTIAVTNKEIGRFIKYDPQSSRHKYSQNVIFSCALSDTYVSNIARFFAGTARNSGFSGDIVVAVLPDAKSELLQVLREYQVIIYFVELNCVKSDKGAVVMCDFMNDQISITLMRMFIYQYWALKYPDTTYIMMSDFRDVMFQSNPFTSKNKFSDWGPSAYDITMFAEQDPNRVINRCRHSSYTLKNCYGKVLHDQIATNTMVNNGILFATRNASLIYVSSFLST